MTDFLSNLILRSAGEQSPLSILQPRLPSLFEPFSGGSGISVPPDPVVNDPVAPTDGQPVLSPSQTELPTHRASRAFRPEYNEPVLETAERRNVLTPEQSFRLPATETPQKMVQPMEPATPSSSRMQTPHTLSPKQEPQRTIMPYPEGSAIRKLLPANQDQPSVTLKERAKILPLRPPSTDPKEVDRAPLSPKQTRDPIQVKIRPLGVDFVLDDSARSTKAESQSAPILQPVFVPSPSGRIQQFESAPEQSPQRVVEIHIGRIEVRASSTSAPLKRASQKTTMSLEEYLRSRPGEKQ